MKIILWIAGAVCGMILGVMAGAALTVARIRRRINKNACAIPEDISEEEKKRLLAVTAEAKKSYKKSQRGRLFSSVFKIKRKKRVDDAKIDYFSLVKKTAEIFNPESESPWLEVSEKELFDFIRSAAEAIRLVLDATGLNFLKKLSLASATEAALFAKKALGWSVVKNARKTFNASIAIVSALNPFFWIRRTVSAFAVFKICDEAVYASVEITVYKFAELYKNSSDRAENSRKTCESA